ncbi:alpha/beta hydrolase [Candidatus Saccharibacteria bacterium]|nr:alpha/beta hydrolase [Candidatus Saccharibacteria bacterium]
MAKNKTKPKISSLYINRLRGRMLYLPSQSKTKKREILLLYGHHASLERMNGIAENLSKYGNVTLPDLPGFGGMKSFYNIGREPTIDNFADYLAAFIKLKYKRKRLTVMSMSFSFLIVTRMLQKYPEIAKKVDLVVSSVGFVHYQDFKLPKSQQRGLRLLGTVFQHKFPAFMFRYLVLTGPVIKTTYKLVAKRHSKMHDAESPEELNKRIQAEIILWQINDVSTRMKTMADMFKVDLCDKKVDLPVYHVSVENDRYFDNRVVEQHMRIIYKDFINIPAEIPAHMPSIVATAEEAELFVPDKLRKLLK